MKKYTMMFIISLIVLGFIFMIKNPINEGFNSQRERCPNILIQKDQQFYLYNSTLAKIPGVNPIKFDNLEEYTEFMNWQRRQGIKCPVLYLQQTLDTQGNTNYKIRPSPGSQQLIDSNRNDPPFNNDQFPGYDPDNQYIGVTTPLDSITQTTDNISPNAMDANWGGIDYTRSLIDQGVYKDDEVMIQIP